MLSDRQKAEFWRDGYLVVENAVSPELLAKLKAEVAEWVELSRKETKPFGPPTIDGRPRFDMGAEHRPDSPALRRINNPSDISESYWQAASDAPMVDAVADLIGPDVKFHHCKINLKLPGARTEVGYHQDYAYTPHSNDDLVTSLLMLDDMTLDNGCLTVIPGSHKGPIHSLWHEGRFTGSVADSLVASMKAEEVSITGPAGAACLMHTALLHGSAANRSNRSRGLYIAVHAAADAVPLCTNVMANPNEGKIVRGKASRRARLVARELDLPEIYRRNSFFEVQGQGSIGRKA